MRVFFACPLTSYMRAQEAGQGSRLLAELVGFLERVEAAVLGAGHELFLAARVEEFGAKVRHATLCTPFDMLEMQRADCLVAFPDKSYGVHVELGWASSMDKPIIVLRNEAEPDMKSPLVAGLDTVSDCQFIDVPPTLLTNVPAQEALCARLVELLSCIQPKPEPRPRYAFLSTSFGFGPVSKAVTIAHELRERVPHAALHFFGSRIDYDFASKSRVFDRIFKIDVDDRESLEQLVPQFSTYAGVFSALNLDILPLWKPSLPPLYLVDSLAWMWAQPPAGIDRVAGYFIQDYLVPPDRLEEYRQRAPVHLVPPIQATGFRKSGVQRPRGPQLLVNFSGCATPFKNDDLLETYARVLMEAILEEGRERFESIVFCSNEALARRLAPALDGVHMARVGHFPHDEFLQLLAQSERVLTSPGITTTVEALALGVPLCFLPPQNYSQALLGERNRKLLGDPPTMALSRFGPDFHVEPNMEEAAGVALVASHLRRVLQTHRPEIHEMVRGLLDTPREHVLEKLRTNISQPWQDSGQKVIVDHVLRAKGHAAPTVGWDSAHEA